MLSFLEKLFESGPFMPHGHCYLWTSNLVWLHVISDLLVGLAYIIIPLTLIYFIRKRKDIPFNWMFVAFGVFIFACGATHFMEIWTVWEARYWLAGAVKMVTAIASVPTAILLVRLVPKAMEIPSPRQLEKINRELQESNRELEAFSFSVSHDLRAPLRVIDGFTRIIMREYGEKLDEDGRNLLSMIKNHSTNMSYLIDNLLNFSRMGREVLNPSQIDMNRLVQEVFEELKPHLENHPVRLRIANLPPAIGDRTMIKQVISNLITNSIKFTRNTEYPEIEVGFKMENEIVIYFIKDNGIGFNMEQSQKLFDVFYRLHSESDFEGSGVGLAIVRRIIERHNGRVWAESQENQGATFYFTLGQKQIALKKEPY